VPRANWNYRADPAYDAGVTAALECGASTKTPNRVI
jgi:hypothetical protein